MLAICAALSWEIRPILRALGSVKRERDGSLRLWKSTTRAEPVVVFRTGIGYEAAEATTRQVLCSLPVRTIVNTGCAGALDDLEVGSVVIPHLLLDLSNARHDTDTVCTRDLQRAATRARLSLTHGPILTSRTALATSVEKRAAHQKFGATAVEMEGTAVAEVARQHSTSFGSARAILDTAELDLPTADGAQNALRSALRLLSSPAPLANAVALANAVKAVQTSLEGLFRCFLDENPHE